MNSSNPPPSILHRLTGPLAMALCAIVALTATAMVWRIHDVEQREIELAHRRQREGLGQTGRPAGNLAAERLHQGEEIGREVTIVFDEQDTHPLQARNAGVRISHRHGVPCAAHGADYRQHARQKSGEHPIAAQTKTPSRRTAHGGVVAGEGFEPPT